MGPIKGEYVIMADIMKYIHICNQAIYFWKEKYDKNQRFQPGWRSEDIIEPLQKSQNLRRNFFYCHFQSIRVLGIFGNLLPK